MIQGIPHFSVYSIVLID